jgi:dienelactone hydrolase
MYRFTMSGALGAILLVSAATAQPPVDCPQWTPIPVPASWEKSGGGILNAYDGVAWYRCFVRVPADWQGETLHLELGRINDSNTTFFNAAEIGRTPSAGLAARFEVPTHSYPIPPAHVRFGDMNLIAVRVQDDGGTGGITGHPARLSCTKGRIRLEGNWQLRTGDDPAWASQSTGREADAFHEAAGEGFGQVVRHQPLEGTAPLTLTGDIASQLVDGVDRFLLQSTQESLAQRDRRWQRDATSPAAYAASIRPNRERLAHIVGLRDSRVHFDAPELIATTDRPALAGRGNGFSVYEIRWPAFGDVSGEGLLLQPDGIPVACVVAIPDADVSPEAIVGLEEGVAPESQYARRLAESGCCVVVPVLVNRQLEKRRGVQLPNREYLYRSAYELGRHILGYEVQKVLAIVDWFHRDSGDSDRPIGLIGWGEGGLLALYGGALDERIDAVLCSGYFESRQGLWQEPMDRNVFGLLEQFGDAEIASLIAPRRLILEAAKGPEVVIPPGLGCAPGRITTPKPEKVRDETARANRFLSRLGENHLVQLVESDAGTGAPGCEAALTAFLAALSANSSLAQLGPSPKPQTDAIDGAARQLRQIAQLDRHNQQLLAESPYVRAEFMKNLDLSSLDAFQRSVTFYRDFFRDQVIGHFADPLLPANPRTRKAYDTENWLGYEVVLDVWPDVVAYGILLVPKDIKQGERRPVVVCQHGLEGRPEKVVYRNLPAYNGFGARLADEGFVVFAPQNLYVFGDRFRTLQRKANPLGKTLFSVIIPQHQQITDWLASLPFVDGDRIGFYGISYGGKTAMRVPPLVDNYSAVICSADFNDWVWKNASSRSSYSYVGTPEYEIFEFDLGSTFNYSEMAALICPRPFMVERGHFDGVSSDERVAYEFAKVRHLYQARLKLANRCEIEWFPGPHEIHAVGTFDFLRRHLAWPYGQNK